MHRYHITCKVSIVSCQISQLFLETGHKKKFAPVCNIHKIEEYMSSFGSLTASGIIERPVAAAGTLSHHVNQSFVARQPYSLRPDAKFEESVTIAIQKLHLVMAHYCAKGWDMQRQWTEANSQQQGDFFLHYQFRCSGT